MNPTYKRLWTQVLQTNRINSSCSTSDTMRICVAMSIMLCRYFLCMNWGRVCALGMGDVCVEIGSVVCVFVCTCVSMFMWVCVCVCLCLCVYVYVCEGYMGVCVMMYAARIFVMNCNSLFNITIFLRSCIYSVVPYKVKQIWQKMTYRTPQRKQGYLRSA